MGLWNRLRQPVDTLRSVVRFRRFELDGTTRRLARAASVHDLRRLAKRRLPGGVFDYIDGAAEDELAMANNSEAYRRICLRPRVLRDVSHVDPSTTLLGRPLPIPLVLAPDRVHPHRRSPGRAGRGPRRRARRPALHAVHAGHPLDRGGRARQDVRAQVVPGLRVARPGDGQGDDRPGPGGRLRGHHGHGRHRRARQARSRRAPRLRAAPQDRAGDDDRRRPPPGLDAGASCATIPSCSPTWPAATTWTAPTP